MPKPLIKLLATFTNRQLIYKRGQIIVNYAAVQNNMAVFQNMDLEMN
jgi:hypothetical protein